MSSEKTEEPTPKRLKEAREKGQVPKSRELGTAAVLLATGGALVATGAAAAESLKGLMSTCLRAAEAPGPPGSMLSFGLAHASDILVPPLAAATLAAALASFLQVGPLLSLKAIEPKLDKLNVFKGIQNLFSRRQLVEFLKTLAKMVLVFYVAWDVLSDGVRGIVGLSGRDASALWNGTTLLAGRLLFRVGGAILALAVLDVFYQRWQHRRDQRMAKDEVKREYKDADGDPIVRQERERMRREILEHNAVESVASADVLIVNPTHLAVALRYDEQQADAPLVVAKGEEHLAARMIAAAERAGVPVMRDVPLARALYELSRDEEIPPVLFEAVAAVLRAAWDERAEESV